MGSHQRVALSDGLPLESAYAPSLTVPIRPEGFSYCKYYDEAKFPSIRASGDIDIHSFLTVRRCAEKRKGIRVTWDVANSHVLQFEDRDAVINRCFKTPTFTSSVQLALKAGWTVAVNACNASELQ